jgi:hypothetical protein
MEHPSPRKSANGVTSYASRQLEVPKFFGDSVLTQQCEVTKRETIMQDHRLTGFVSICLDFIVYQRTYVLEYASRALGS